MHQEEKSTTDETTAMSLKAVRQAVMGEIEQGYDVPFATFPWKRWEEMQGQFLQNMSRYQRAIENQRLDAAFFAALELQEIVVDLLKEASSWIGVLPETKPKEE
jgi:hypothetical protein